MDSATRFSRASGDATWNRFRVKIERWTIAQRLSRQFVSEFADVVTREGDVQAQLGRLRGGGGDTR